MSASQFMLPNYHFPIALGSVVQPSPSQVKLEIKTCFVAAIDTIQMKIELCLSHAQWETRRDKAHGLLIWVEPLEVAFLLLSPIGGLLPGLTSDRPTPAELMQWVAEASHPFTQACSDLGGGCAKDRGLPTPVGVHRPPHIAALCPKAVGTAGCPFPGAPLCANLHRWPQEVVEGAEWQLHACKALSYLGNQDHVLRRLISSFVMLGFRPAIYIDVGPVWATV